MGTLGESRCAGRGVRIADEIDIFGKYPGNVILARTGWLSKNPDDVRRYLKALHTAQQIYRKDPAAALNTCEAIFRVHPYCLNATGRVAPGALATLADMAMQTTLLTAYPGKRLTTISLSLRRFSAPSALSARWLYRHTGTIRQE